MLCYGKTYLTMNKYCACRARAGILLSHVEDEVHGYKITPPPYMAMDEHEGFQYVCVWAKVVDSIESWELI